MAAAPQPLAAPQSFGEAFVRKGALRELASAGQVAKTAAEIAGLRSATANAAEQNRINAEKNAIAAAEAGATAGLRSSQVGLNEAMARKAEAEAAAGKYVRLQRKVPTGETDIAGMPVMRTEEYLYDQANKQFVEPPSAAPTVQTPTAASIAKMKANKGDTKMEAEYKQRFGSLPY